MFTMHPFSADSPYFSITTSSTVANSLQTESVVDNVEGAQKELLKYWSRVSGNRWLIASKSLLESEIFFANPLCSRMLTFHRNVWCIDDFLSSLGFDCRLNIHRSTMLGRTTTFDGRKCSSTAEHIPRAVTVSTD